MRYSLVLTALVAASATARASPFKKRMAFSNTTTGGYISDTSGHLSAITTTTLSPSSAYEDTHDTLYTSVSTTDTVSSSHQHSHQHRSDDGNYVTQSYISTDTKGNWWDDLLRGKRTSSKTPSNTKPSTTSTEAAPSQGTDSSVSSDKSITTTISEPSVNAVLSISSVLATVSIPTLNAVSSVGSVSASHSVPVSSILSSTSSTTSTSSTSQADTSSRPSSTSTYKVSSVPTSSEQSSIPIGTSPAITSLSTSQVAGTTGSSDQQSTTISTISSNVPSSDSSIPSTSAVTTPETSSITLIESISVEQTSLSTEQTSTESVFIITSSSPALVVTPSSQYSPSESTLRSSTIVSTPVLAVKTSSSSSPSSSTLIHISSTEILSSKVILSSTETSSTQTSELSSSTTTEPVSNVATSISSTSTSEQTNGAPATSTQISSSNIILTSSTANTSLLSDATKSAANDMISSKAPTDIYTSDVTISMTSVVPSTVTNPTIPELSTGPVSSSTSNTKTLPLLTSLQPQSAQSTTVTSATYMPTSSSINLVTSTTTTSHSDPNWWVASDLMTASEEASTTTQASATVATGSLPQAIAAPTEVTVPDEYSLITIGFKKALNYEFVVATPESSAQLFSYLPLALSSPFNNSFTNISVYQIVPLLENSLGYYITVAEVYFPEKEIANLEQMIKDNSSALFTENVGAPKTLVGLIDPSIPLVGLLSSTTSNSSVSETGSSVSPTDSGQVNSGSNSDSDSSSGEGFVSSNDIGSLDYSGKSTSASAGKTTSNKKVTILIACVVIGGLLFITLTAYILHVRITAFKDQKRKAEKMSFDALSTANSSSGSVYNEKEKLNDNESVVSDKINAWMNNAHFENAAYYANNTNSNGAANGEEIDVANVGVRVNGGIRIISRPIATSNSLGWNEI